MRTTSWIALSLLFLVAAFAAARGTPAPSSAADRTVAIGRVSWHTDLQGALALARRENKPLWVHFGENPG